MEEKPLKDKVDVGLEFKPFIYIDVLSFWFNKFIWFQQKQQFWIILLDQFWLLYLSLRVFVSEMEICVFYHTVPRIVFKRLVKGDNLT